MTRGKKTYAADGSFVVPIGSFMCQERVYIQVVGTGFTGTVNFQKSITDAPFADIAYRDESDETIATADIAADGFFSVNGSGGDVKVLITRAAGSVDIYFWRGEL